MHLTSLLIGALLTLATNAAPVTDSPSQSEVPDESELFQRDSGQLCRILYTTHANCRTGPGTNYKSVLGLNKEWTRGYWFTCVKSGECITLNGAVNWYVHAAIPLLLLLCLFQVCLCGRLMLVYVVGGIISRRMGVMLMGIIRTVLVPWVCLLHI